MYYECVTKSHLYNNYATNCGAGVLQNHTSCIINVIQDLKIVHCDFTGYIFEFIVYFLMFQG